MQTNHPKETTLTSPETTAQVEKRFNRIMLVLAREAACLSQSALAKGANISQGALSKIENGLVEPDSATVAALAGFLAIPESLFYLEGRDRPLPLTFFRKKKAQLGLKQVRAIQAKVNLTRMRLEILLRGAEIPEPRLLFVDARDRGGNVEKVAAELRLHWGLPEGPIDNLTGLLERFGVLVVVCDFGTDQVDGLSIFDPSVALPPMIFIRPMQNGDRMRFTLAHELGHIVLHHHLGIPNETSDMEDEAHRFASEFLMPAKIIRGQLVNLTISRLAQLKLVWKVSMAALLMRARRLGVVSKQIEEMLWRQLGKAGRTVEPVAIPPEQPRQLAGVVKQFVEQYGYSVRDMSSLLHQSQDHFKAQFMLQSTHLQLV